MTDLITLAELLETLGISRSTAYRLFEEPGFPIPIRIGGSLRFARADVESFVDRQKTAAAWSAYARALQHAGPRGMIPTGNGLASHAAALGLSDEEIELHRLCLAEVERLEKEAEGLAAAEQEFKAAHEKSATGTIGPATVLCPELAERQGRAAHARNRCIDAQRTADGIRAFAPLLFGLDPRTACACILLPEPIRRQLVVIAAAKRERQRQADAAAKQEEQTETLPWWQGRQTQESSPAQ